MEGIGLALLYPAHERSVCAPGHHGYPRASDLILCKALGGQMGHQITDATDCALLIQSNQVQRVLTSIDTNRVDSRDNSLAGHGDAGGLLDSETRQEALPR